MKRAAFLLLLAAIAVGSLTGCAAGAFDSDRPYQQLYMLSGLPPRSPAPSVIAADVAVAHPQVRPGLDTDRIAVLYPDRRLDYFAASRWGGTSDAVVRSLLIESLRNNAGLRSVQADSSAFGAQYLLQTEIADFQAEYAQAAGAPTVHVQLIVTLGRYSERRPLASFAADARVAADSNSLSAVVAAFEKACHAASLRVSDEVRATLEKQPAATAQ